MKLASYTTPDGKPDFGAVVGDGVVNLREKLGNKWDDLREALAGAVAQTADVEVLVIDDGSTDGTSEMVRDEFPQVVLHRSEESHGLIVQRTRAASLASAPVIVSIDDDARLPSARTVEQALADFDHPRVGAVAMPYVDVRRSPEPRQVAPDREGVWVTSSYIGTAHALRRDVFLALGGYRGHLIHMTEEPDYCLRMLAAGYVTRLGRSDLLHHLESPKRMYPRNVLLGRRNEILHGWHNVPVPELAVRWAKVVAHSLVLIAQWRQVRAGLRGLARGFADSWRYRAERRPVPRGVYRVDHDIRRRGPLRVEEIDARLPPPAL